LWCRHTRADKEIYAHKRTLIVSYRHSLHDSSQCLPWRTIFAKIMKMSISRLLKSIVYIQYFESGMDTIDFNKHDIDIFINLAKIVRYGRHWDESCNEWRYDTINVRLCAYISFSARVCLHHNYWYFTANRTFDVFILISVKWNLSSHILYFIYMQRLAVQFVEMHEDAYKFLYILISIRVTIAFYF
jgi:hypothetical protein